MPRLSDVLKVPALTRTPHESYAESLRTAGLADAPLGRQWLVAAEQALAQATPIALPRREAIWFPAAGPRAVALRAPLRRGQRVVVEATVESAAPTRVFLDLFEDETDDLDHVTHAEADATSFSIEIERDADYVLRLQPELLQDARVTLVWRVEPTLALPVQGATRSSIQSYFMDPRNGGARDHHGIDIFGRRGTPVVAAADGLVTSVGTNNLGGNVVWVARGLGGESHYYAHLDTQSVSTGRRVRVGEVLGTVGTTGNAAGGAPHLHFGIYTRSGPVDPLPYLQPAVAPPAAIVAAPLGEQRRLTSSQRVATSDNAGTSSRVVANAAGVTAPVTYAAGTIVEIVGASSRSVRVRLPDGTEGYLPSRVLTDLTSRLRTVRVTSPTAVASAPLDGITIDTLTAPATLDVLGTFSGALFVRTPTGVTGWIRG